MPGESQWTFQTNPDGTVTSTVTGRETIEVNRKIQPWWWFYNSDDPKPPTDYVPDRANWLRIAMWYMRNPIHNGNFYVWVPGVSSFPTVRHSRRLFPVRPSPY
jgi:hypothetical protein